MITSCNYAPPGEYIKDHSLMYHDGWWHLFSISGTAGYCHLYNGNEETISWSISRNLVDWDFRGHVLHASLRRGEFDQHEVWAPFCIKSDGRFYMFYTGIVHPVRPMCYKKLGHNHPNVVWDGHRETIGLAMSEDLTCWEKIADRQAGINIPGRDPHVVRDTANNRWLLYSTGGVTNGMCEELVSQSHDLINWEFIGVAARFPQLGLAYSTTESMYVMQHPGFYKNSTTVHNTHQNYSNNPISKQWIMMGNWHYALSDNPTDFTQSEVRQYVDGDMQNWSPTLGFAGEIIEWQGKWYRSGVVGEIDHWKLGFKEIVWEKDGAFRVV